MTNFNAIKYKLELLRENQKHRTSLVKIIDEISIDNDNYATFMTNVSMILACMPRSFFEDTINSAVEFHNLFPSITQVIPENVH